LRFQPSGGLPVASEYKVELDPAKIVKEGQVFTGETELTVRTDKFLVEEVTVLEEPALEGKAKVVYRGEIRFNYPVNPETLAPLVKIEDRRRPSRSRSSSRRTTRTRSSATARSPSRKSGTSGRSGSPSPGRSPPPTAMPHSARSTSRRSRSGRAPSSPSAMSRRCPGRASRRSR
jgi:hypothetical protein